VNEHSFIFAPRMRTRDENKERSIRDKALKMIVSEGLNGFSMQKLAKAANVSPATLYIYFKDKEDLVFQLCREASEKMLDITFKNFDPSMNFKEGLKIQWENRAAYCMKYPDQMHFIEQLRHSPYGERITELTGQKFRKLMGDFTANAIEHNELIKVPVEVYWSIAFAPLYNLVKFHMTGKSLGAKRFVLTDKVIKETFELVLKALTP
jgi:AcrR family transcriptional regulator